MTLDRQFFVISIKTMIQNTELENDIVTLSVVQVGLRAQDCSIPSELSAMSREADTTTPKGLLQILQNSARSLLNHSPSWTHVLGYSQTFPSRDRADAEFQQISWKERQKFSAETLTNVEGKINEPSALPYPNPGDPAYIVVTLLVGTAHDRPLFDRLNSRDQLHRAIEILTEISEEYLLVFELLWTPQIETDTLSEAQMHEHYGQTIPIS
ncbi:DUF1517 domain-containing protein [Oxynema sp. CENA135]|uniref:DUF1517 domain-containing protein n=1 Tax=Oxynema sp. CENA135 TaxID=984206 RepID=UPI001F1BB170|nr:DUF1517 domain-containing protein [Oxynema sp. CENA135]